jgi:hypothetical protein
MRTGAFPRSVGPAIAEARPDTISCTLSTTLRPCRTCSTSASRSVSDLNRVSIAHTGAQLAFYGAYHHNHVNILIHVVFVPILIW